jgi:hypothetical protein
MAVVAAFTPPAKRAEPPKAETKSETKDDQMPRAEALATVQIARRFAPQAEPAGQAPTRRLLPPIPSGVRLVIAILALIAFLPNLIFAAMFWLSTTNTSWQGPVMAFAAGKFAPEALQSKNALRKSVAVLWAPATVEATAGEEVAFPLSLDGADAAPIRSIIAISGLPQGSVLTNGRSYGGTEWNLTLDEIAGLRLVIPDTASGETELGIQLIAPDGKTISDAQTVLKVAADPEPAPAPGSSDGAEAVSPTDETDQLSSYGVASVREGGLAWLKQVQDLETEGAGAEAAEAAQPESGNPAEPSPASAAPSDDANAASSAGQDIDPDAKWIEITDYFNLRSGPTRSAGVIGVVQKGSKLQELGRKRGWVKVVDPKTSKTGWFYPRAWVPRQRGFKQAEAPKSESESSGLFSGFGSWLTGSGTNARTE